MFVALFSVPSASDIITAVEPYSSGFLTAFLPWVWFISGTLVGAMLALWIGRVVVDSVQSFLSSRRSGAYHYEGVNLVKYDIE
jgi:hypothetical protein